MTHCTFCGHPDHSSFQTGCPQCGCGAPPASMEEEIQALKDQLEVMEMSLQSSYATGLDWERQAKEAQDEVQQLRAALVAERASRAQS